MNSPTPLNFIDLGLVTCFINSPGPAFLPLPRPKRWFSMVVQNVHQWSGDGMVIGTIVEVYARLYKDVIVAFA